MNKDKVVEAIVRQGFLPLYFHPDEMVSIEVLKALYESGIRVVEYTNRGKQALKNFRSLVKESYNHFPDLILGLGTTMDSKAAAKAIQNGADFLVSPVYTKDLAKFSNNENILWIPGCLTPTELFQAQGDGITMVKIFPANTVGPAFIKAAKEIFPDLYFMPTGGVDIGNIESWFKAGVSAVGMGSSLISKASMENRNFEGIRTKASALINQIAAIRSSLV